jgi:ribosomal protein L24
MNKDLSQLLTITPGVIRDRCGLVYQHIEREEGLKLLDMPVDSDMQIASGRWVKVRRGIYKGDVGHVIRTTQDSRVQVLLVPRLLSPTAIGVRAQTHPTPALFDHETTKQVYGAEPVRINENVYSFGGNTFEHGLIIKEFPFNSISTTASSMPLHLFNLFRESLHPNLKACESRFPRPSEWCFAEGDEVYIRVQEGIYATYTPATISILRTDSVDVTTKEGIVNVPWLDIRKIFHEGDYVEITGGMYQGQTGWVVKTDYVQEQAGLVKTWYGNHVATIILQCEEKEALLSGMEVCQILESTVTALGSCSLQIEAHINLLKHAVVPHVLGTHPRPSNAIPLSERLPWINTAVFVSGRHSMRTYPGIVKNVLTGQQTASGLKLQIQPTHMDPNLPFRLITLDYDNVVEARYLLVLNNSISIADSNQQSRH